MEKNGNVDSKKTGVAALSSLDHEEHRRKSGLNVYKAAFFMVAQMAGAGFLALPRAFADVGWLALALLFIFCCSSGFAATRMGLSWVMLEERYPEYKKPARQPYIEIAFRSLGPIGRKVSLCAMLFCNLGSSTVYIILISELINSVFAQFSLCQYALMVVALLIPLSWLGTPKDFWWAPIFAVVSTILAVIIITTEIFLTYEVEPMFPPPEHPNPTFPSFFLGFGAILFSFGGMTVFPTVQNDMKDRTQFWKSVLMSFSTVVTLYFPVALFGYIYIGDSVESNIFLSLDTSPALSVAIMFQIVNLLMSYIITLSPIFQCFEDIFHIPHHFCVKRVSLRTGIVLIELLIALAFPDFGLIVNLIGGSAMATVCFILPPIMFLRLIDDHTDPQWPKRTIPKWQRIYLWEIFCVGIVGGIASTITSLYALLRPETLDKSCFVQFGPE